MEILPQKKGPFTLISRLIAGEEVISIGKQAIRLDGLAYFRHQIHQESQIVPGQKTEAQNLPGPDQMV